MSDNLALLTNLVTILGLPIGIATYWIQRNIERDNEERLIYENLVSGYDDFLRLVLDNSDLRLWALKPAEGLDESQLDRLHVIFEILVSLFERAYILSFSEKMTAEQARRWAAWHSYMRDWCKREDFKARLPLLLPGSDARFSAYLMRIAESS
jgi:hypothetical protein